MPSILPLEPLRNDLTWPSRRACARRTVRACRSRRKKHIRTSLISALMQKLNTVQEGLHSGPKQAHPREILMPHLHCRAARHRPSRRWGPRTPTCGRASRDPPQLRRAAQCACASARFARWHYLVPPLIVVWSAAFSVQLSLGRSRLTHIVGVGVRI